ncbi:2,3,4,5-tetrahydropyridine-2,6-dicarboxylate N-acetyltransferase [Romboutsia sp. 1001216sp1]|uniref:2,3,4,5-tetrahydropyridine-2,6-dicarboxylate N-acetyltransferase n=1 Tax=unclassified Romboutsia TaxID=2626894 RepID=UPI00189F52BC|nr:MULTISPECIES: 2,3,4,5-tetrahydropyridine-2,6-dicarboxylate N-acetyltransferase [unclassified Romboutsia]MDB8789219.1 2,3,4,5-tetrahydropyridine-2,6-dicarboxylate N-acetyltransferase [Romboutsia sp. 1001216sp1]MDB8802205.1 2,3,4,5-tetrahydropyridine-2,6-dicarboxylate N-acetyltransferase [Romboutsia sp. 1001216sp1]MDB8813602.1 2,3,4,5-tetrahydropyridine-2,6-dicarboxylate N-acetyltransferase [Romboutsia sp. 1001216sp1]
MINLNDAYEIAKYIKESKKITPVKVYINTNLISFKEAKEFKVFGSNGSYILIGDYDTINDFLKSKENLINDIYIEYDRRNSAIPIYNYLHEHARIEPGAIIRDMATIGKNAVIMMGAVINIGAVIGDNAMIDMNAVIGARGIIGKNVHVGAGAVIAGVLEPPSASPVIIEDDVLIGANAVILEGVTVKKGAIVAAGSVVTHDVLEGEVVAGSPAKVIKIKDEKTADKTKLMDGLRDLD